MSLTVVPFHQGRVLSTPLCPAADLSYSTTAVQLAVRHEDASFAPFSFTLLRIQETRVCVSPVEPTPFYLGPNTNPCITGQLIHAYRSFSTSPGHDEEVADACAQASFLVR